MELHLPAMSRSTDRRPTLHTTHSVIDRGQR